MCGRIVWVWDPKMKRMVRRFDDGYGDEESHVLEKRRYNVPPSSHVPVLVGRPEGIRLEIRRWGVPIPQRPNGVFNTRSETAATSPMWAKMTAQPAVFPVTGFYEWRRDGKRRTPYFIHRADGEPMLLAGLWTDHAWQGTSLQCASILTRDPVPAIEHVHDRMPCLLELEEAQQWLDAAVSVDELPTPGDVLALHEVSSKVNDASNDAPELMQPVAAGGWF